MARRAIWRAAVTFENVRVPVKLYSAVREQRVNFRLLHDEDSAPLRQQMVCQKDGKAVESEERVKALRVKEDEFVLVEPEELDRLAPGMEREIHVWRFVPQGQVDGRYVDRPYFLGPDGEEEKYASLAEAMQEAGAAGLCQWSFRKRSYAGELRAKDGVLELVALHLKEELSNVKDLELPSPALSEKELKTARYLIDEMSGEFDISGYENRFQKRLEQLVQAKARGEKIEPRPAKEHKPTEEDELLDVLEGSLKQARQKAHKGKAHAR